MLHSSHEGLMYKLQNVDIGGPILEVFMNLLFGRSSNTKLMVQEVLWLIYCLVFLMIVVWDHCSFYIVYFWPPTSVREYLDCADDSTLMTSVSSPSERLVVAACINRDLALINAWCNRCYMLINPSKTYGLIISRSRTGDLYLDY